MKLQPSRLHGSSRLIASENRRTSPRAQLSCSHQLRFSPINAFLTIRNSNKQSYLKKYRFSNSNLPTGKSSDRNDPVLRRPFQCWLDFAEIHDESSILVVMTRSPCWDKRLVPIWIYVIWSARRSLCSRLFPNRYPFSVHKTRQWSRF